MLTTLIAFAVAPEDRLLPSGSGSSDGRGQLDRTILNMDLDYRYLKLVV